MKLKTITLNLGCKLSPRSYNNIEAHVTVSAELEEGDDIDEAGFELHCAAHSMLAANISSMTSKMSPDERIAAMEMIGIPQDALNDGDDDEDTGGDNDDDNPPDGDLEDDDDVEDNGESDEETEDESTAVLERAI